MAATPALGLPQASAGEVQAEDPIGAIVHLVLDLSRINRLVAGGRAIALNPLAAMPEKTTFHELGHVLLDHTTETISDGAALPRNLREVEAECVALLCTESLGLDGAEYCRGYVQHWLRGERIAEASAVRIFKVADAILRAGRPIAEAEGA